MKYINIFYTICSLCLLPTFAGAQTFLKRFDFALGTSYELNENMRLSKMTDKNNGLIATFSHKPSFNVELGFRPTKGRLRYALSYRSRYLTQLGRFDGLVPHQYFADKDSPFDDLTHIKTDALYATANFYLVERKRTALSLDLKMYGARIQALPTGDILPITFEATINGVPKTIRYARIMGIEDNWLGSEIGGTFEYKFGNGQWTFLSFCAVRRALNPPSMVRIVYWVNGIGPEEIEYVNVDLAYSLGLGLRWSMRKGK